MSRVAKIPVLLPKEVEATVTDQTVILKGSQGTMSRDFSSLVEIINKDQRLCVSPKDSSKAGNMFAGTTRALLANMLEGVATGFQKKLEITGVGYRAQVQGRVLNLTLGYSHPIHFDIPEGITIQTPSTTEIVVKGANKQQVGQIAANIRRYRPPEPYKGKGIRYAGEVIRRKEAKKA